MGYQIDNLGPSRQSGDHKAKAIEKYPDTRIETVAYGLRVHCSTFELVWISQSKTSHYKIARYEKVICCMSFTSNHATSDSEVI